MTGYIFSPNAEYAFPVRGAYFPSLISRFHGDLVAISIVPKYFLLSFPALSRQPFYSTRVANASFFPPLKLILPSHIFLFTPRHLL